MFDMRTYIGFKLKVMLFSIIAQPVAAAASEGPEKSGFHPTLVSINLRVSKYNR